MDIVTILISTVLVSLGFNSVRMSHHSETIFASGALRSLRVLQFVRFIRVDRRGSSWKLIKQVGFFTFFGKLIIFGELAIFGESFTFEYQVISDNSSELLTAYYFAFIAIVFGSYIVYELEHSVNSDEFSSLVRLFGGVLLLLQQLATVIYHQ